MNKDLTGDSAVWRVLQRRWVAAFNCLSSTLPSTCQRGAEDGFAADDGSVSGDGHSSRCCTLGELSHHRDRLSVIALQEKCDEQEAGIAVLRGRRNVITIVITFRRPRKTAIPASCSSHFSCKAITDKRSRWCESSPRVQHRELCPSPETDPSSAAKPSSAPL